MGEAGGEGTIEGSKIAHRAGPRNDRGIGRGTYTQGRDESVKVGSTGFAGSPPGLAKARRETTIRPHPMRLLVVEDDFLLANSLRLTLAGAGFAIDVAGACADAMSLWQVNPYDGVVLDLGLPDGDGRELLDLIRSSSGSAPVLIVSARGEIEQRVEALAAGADAYLAKPFCPTELIARVRALLRRPPSWTPSALSIGNLVLDRNHVQARVADSPLPLTVKEWAILEYLSVRLDRLVTRTMLLDHCWNDGYEGLSNLVDVHIARLRRKLEQAAASCRIETVRGAGFILRAS